MEYDCGFSRDNNRFRYRAAAIIVEEGYERLSSSKTSWD